jgi:hypothetical protein
VVLTADMEGERGRSQSGSPLFLGFSRGGGVWSRRAATVLAVPEGLPCNSWIFLGFIL